MSQSSPYILSRIGAGSFFEILLNETFGSASSAANQQFDIAVPASGVLVGQKAVVTSCEFRGDFSATNEFVNIGFGLSTNPKFSVGVIGTDSSVYAGEASLVGVVFDLVDIGAGVPGVRAFVSPDAAVNFSPGGMPNGWWWQLRMSFQAVRF